jgi:hypothetical protein
LEADCSENRLTLKNRTHEIDETQLMTRARELGLEIPADQRLGVLKGANHLLRLADMVRDFARSKGIPDQ